ncbi:hypothetical protein ACB098_12G070100 [Castanea mollissima]
MIRLINKETMNLKAAPPKRLLLMETMTRANRSYSCQIQAPPPCSSRTDLLTIKTVTYNKIKRHSSSTNKLAIRFLVQREQRATTLNPLERENTPPKRETRERKIAK